MTLDRKDNTIGHVQSNVVPACYRCNLTRGDMPYEAWVYLIDGMRLAREAGAFGNWKSKLVRQTGLEPARRMTPPSESGASSNSATDALVVPVGLEPTNTCF